MTMYIFCRWQSLAVLVGSSTPATRLVCRSGSLGLLPPPLSSRPVHQQMCSDHQNSKTLWANANMFRFAMKIFCSGAGSAQSAALASDVNEETLDWNGGRLIEILCHTLHRDSRLRFEPDKVGTQYSIKIFSCLQLLHFLYCPIVPINIIICDSLLLHSDQPFIFWGLDLWPGNCFFAVLIMMTPWWVLPQSKMQHPKYNVHHPKH